MNLTQDTQAIKSDTFITHPNNQQTYWMTDWSINQPEEM